MSKKSRIILITALALVFVLAFVGCQSYGQKPITGGDASAKVESNGGSIVKQGDYYYFVNGLNAYANIKVPKDNYFGSIIKGSIVRAKQNADGKFEDYQIIVPKMVLSSTTEVGFSIYGEWIYYVSPSIATDKLGAVQTTYLEYLRTKIDGSKTQSLAIIEGQSTTYSFTAEGMFYFKDSKLHGIAVDNKKVGKDVVLAEDVASVNLPKITTYTPNATTNANFAFYLTKSANEEMTNNVLMAVDVNNNKKTIIDEKTFQPTETIDKALAYTISIKKIDYEADGVVVYYDKTSTVFGESRNLGLFAYKFADSAFAFDKAKEVQISSKSYSSIYPISLAEGAFVTDKTVVEFVKNENGKLINKKPFDSTKSITDKDYYYSFPANITILNIDSGVMLYSVNSIVSKIKFDLTKDEMFVTDAEQIAPNEKYDATFVSLEYINGYIYYFNTNYYNYMSRMKIDTYDASDSKKLLIENMVDLNKTVTKADLKSIKDAEKKK
ncbi:MAG: hypothetical protein RRY78_01935 [Clostridia bacterium]